MAYSNYLRAFQAGMDRQAVKPNYAMTFRNWQKQAVSTRSALENVKRVLEEESAKIREEYRPNVAFEKIAALKEEYETVRQIAENDLKAKLGKVMASKRAQLAKASQAPTEADLRMLQTLKLRTKLTEDEVIRAAESLSNNLPALAVLRDISDAAGFDIPIPVAADFEADIESAGAYAESMVRSIGKDGKELNYKENEFFNFPDAKDGYAAQAFDRLDSSSFTQETVKNHITTKLNTEGIREAAAGKQMVEVTLNAGDSLSNLCYQFHTKFEALEKANPNKDIYDLQPGDTILVPSARFDVRNGHGWIKAEQISAVQTAGSKLDADVFKSASQLKTATAAAGMSEGSSVKVPSMN